MRPQTLGSAAVVGLATGSRSFTGLAAVTLATPRDTQAQPDRLLGHPTTKTVIGLMALQEWIMDKLPTTPSRLEAPGLIARAVCAGATGAVLARRAQLSEVVPPLAVVPSTATEVPAEPVEPLAPDWTAVAACTAASVATAVGFAFVGVRLRGRCNMLFGRDWPGAVLEDALSAGLATAAVRLSRTG